MEARLWVSHVVEQFVVIAIFEAAFVSASDRCTEGGQEDDVLGILSEDVLYAFQNEACHVRVPRYYIVALEVWNSNMCIYTSAVITSEADCVRQKCCTFSRETTMSIKPSRR